MATVSDENQPELESLRNENQHLRAQLSQLTDLNLRITASLDLPTVL